MRLTYTISQVPTAIQQGNADFSTSAQSEKFQFQSGRYNMMMTGA
jgi:hypothetical protein